MLTNNKKLRVLTWNVHGNYLYYLTQTDCIFYIPVQFPKHSGYIGKSKKFPWGNNVKEVPAYDIKHLSLDCILFQSNFSFANPSFNFLEEQMQILSAYQLRYVPKLFIEHDPPRNHPTDSKHILYNSIVPVVHVTYFNQLMWDTGTTRTFVVPHGVLISNSARYTGKLKKGIVVVNNLFQRGRRLGIDIFKKVQSQIPLDIVGMGSEELGGLGEIPIQELPSLISQYRFFFHPARYTSLGLAVAEAMTVGLPVVGFATTELPTIIQNGKNGFIHTNVSYLIKKMRLLLQEKKVADKISKEAKKTGAQKFSIKKFTSNWKKIIENNVHPKSSILTTL